MDSTVLKQSEPDRFVLLLAYPANKPDALKAADGRLDFASPRATERACWGFMLKGAKVGRFHADVLKTGDPHYGPDTAVVVENTCYRGPDWVTKAADGSEVVIKAGDWLVGLILSEEAWNLYKQGLITGASPQGHANRAKPSATALAGLRTK